MRSSAPGPSVLAMTLLGTDAYLHHIRTESARFLEVLTSCPPDARVPSCPDWDAADLLWHLGEVQHWWHHVIATRPAAPDAYVDPVRPASYCELLDFFREWHEKFVNELVAADPADAAWSWSARPEHHNVAFTYRRQAHEALVHRLDAELAAGSVTPLPTELAADGVDEALDVMYGGLPSWGHFDGLDKYVEYRITDTGESVWAQLGMFSGSAPDGAEHADEKDQHVVSAPGRAADLVVSGTADALDSWLWHRGSDGVEIEGDPAVRDHVASVLGNPIN